MYKVSIPGVTVPQGRDDSDKPTSGSGVMRWVQANWDALTPDQQAVINRYLVVPNDGMVPVYPAKSATASAVSRTSAGRSRFPPRRKPCRAHSGRCAALS